jgi:hypothetical protein
MPVTLDQYKQMIKNAGADPFLATDDWIQSQYQGGVSPVIAAQMIRTGRCTMRTIRVKPPTTPIPPIVKVIAIIPIALIALSVARQFLLEWQTPVVTFITPDSGEYTDIRNDSRFKLTGCHIVETVLVQNSNGYISSFPVTQKFNVDVGETIEALTFFEAIPGTSHLKLTLNCDQGEAKATQILKTSNPR